MLVQYLVLNIFIIFVDDFSRVTYI